MKDGRRCYNEAYLKESHLVEFWTTDGKVSGAHRISGPALIWDDGFIEWYVNNEICKDFAEFQKLSKSTDEDMLAIRLRWPIFNPYD